ncbi:MAG: hypothetical protein B7Y05_03930 [Polynucleobacter sp. 24-46-87]|jgi:hypothetical protein|nr:MAG: hypothetical protein B7Y05_03930 [Polynucleobacter sp. 24-46-87]HQR84481.1 hypothetical protein [Polynucleobacter sp.]
MTYIVSYQKFIDSDRTVEIALPIGESNQRVGQELATVDEVTYVALPDNAVLPEQPQEITVSTVALTPELKAQISANSPSIELINQLVVEKIAKKYSVNDEIKLLRTQPSPQFDEYNAYVESCRAWGRNEKALLGL